MAKWSIVPQPQEQRGARRVMIWWSPVRKTALKIRTSQTPTVWLFLCPAQRPIPALGMASPFMAHRRIACSASGSMTGSASGSMTGSSPPADSARGVPSESTSRHTSCILGCPTFSGPVCAYLTNMGLPGYGWLTAGSRGCSHGGIFRFQPGGEG